MERRVNVKPWGYASVFVNLYKKKRPLGCVLNGFIFALNVSGGNVKTLYSSSGGMNRVGSEASLFSTAFSL